jgi:hypothetical protein
MRTAFDYAEINMRNVHVRCTRCSLAAPATRDRVGVFLGCRGVSGRADGLEVRPFLAC